MKAPLLAVILLLDVMPHCGGPKVVVREPGEDCGHHGPRWRGDCHEPAACFSLSSGGTRCTRACSTDEDCAALGPDFRCADQGRPYANAEGATSSVCARN
ncbi:MAG: hypothetical protein JNM17_29750 [Archangium sp.]|nr:hypothetical protein [Archangium sp.]